MPTYFTARAAALVAAIFAVALGPVTAQAANRAPTISGTPPSSVKVGAYYNFVPTASDADGNKLKFSIQNKPSWLVFNAGNGRLSKVAAAANVGTYNNIVISVSDG